MCGFCEGDSVVLCGMTYAGTEEAVSFGTTASTLPETPLWSRISGIEGVSMGSRRNYQRSQPSKGESPLHILPVADKMIGFTLSTTDNPKRFPKKIRFSVTNKIQGHALAIYDYLVEANEIFPIMDDQDKADRLKLQRAALTECKKLLHMIQLSKDRGYIDSGTFDYWTKLTVDVKCMTARWYDAERKTGIPVEPAGPDP